jgi:hypothetical protein
VRLPHWCAPVTHRGISLGNSSGSLGNSPGGTGLIQVPGRTSRSTIVPWEGLRCCR